MASAEEPRFKASDLLKAAGLTYRQLHLWETQAGIVPSERATEQGWRRFTGEEALALCVCSGLRRQFSVPLKDVGRLYLWLVGRKPDKVNSTLADLGEQQVALLEADSKVAAVLQLQGAALTEALGDPVNQYIVKEFSRWKLNSLARHPILLASKLLDLGFPPYLCTTFRSSLILQERNLVQWVANRVANEPTIVYPLADTINEFRKSLKLEAATLDRIFPSFRTELDKLQEDADVSITEREVIRLIREREYQRVTVHVDGGEIIRANVAEEVAFGKNGSRERALLQVIRERAYQTVEVVVRDGKVAKLSRRSPRKFRRKAGRT